MSQVFWSTFAQTIYAGITVGLVVLGVTYMVVDRGLRLRERREARRALLRTILGEVKRELEFDLAKAERVVEGAPDVVLPYPLFEVNGWDFFQQADVLTILDPRSLEPLMRSYNRLRVSNEQYAQIYDLFWGRTAISVATLVTQPDGPQRFDEYRRRQHALLVQRVTELIPVLQDALAALGDALLPF